MSMFTAVAAESAVSTATSTTSTGPDLPSGDRIADAGSDQATLAAVKQAAKTSTSGPAPGLVRVHLLRLNRLERGKDGKPKKDQPSWHEARPLAAKAFWHEALAKAELSPRDFRVALHLALREATHSHGLFKASKTLAAEIGMDDRNLRTVLDRLAKAGLLARATHTTTTGARPGDLRRLRLFVVDLDAKALAEASNDEAVYTGKLDEVVAPKPASTMNADKKRQRLEELRQRSTQPPGSTMNPGPGSTTDPGIDEVMASKPGSTTDAGINEPGLGRPPTRKIELTPCNETIHDQDDRQGAASTTDAQKESQEELLRDSSYSDSRAKRERQDSLPRASARASAHEQRSSGADAPSPAPASPVISPSAPEVGACGASLEGKSPAGGNPNLAPFQPFQPCAVPSSPVEVAPPAPALPHQLARATAPVEVEVEVAAPGEALAAGHDLARPVLAAAGAVPAGGVTFNPDHDMARLLVARAKAGPGEAAGAWVKLDQAYRDRVLRALPAVVGLTGAIAFAETLAGHAVSEQMKYELKAAASAWRGQNEEKTATYTCQNEEMKTVPGGYGINKLIDHLSKLPSAA